MKTEQLRKPIVQAIFIIILTILSIWLFGFGYGFLPPLAQLLDPINGVWKNARMAEHPPENSAMIEGLSDSVKVIRDVRGVPHIFAKNAKDLAFAFGYVQAQDRLWQMDIGWRGAAGRTSEIFGQATLGNDLSKYQNGLIEAAKKSMEAVKDSEEFHELQAYARGINTYINSLNKSDLPLEFKLFDYQPEPWQVLNSFLFIKSITWVLSSGPWESEEEHIRVKLGDEAYEQLFPKMAPYSVPIIAVNERSPMKHRLINKSVQYIATRQSGSSPFESLGLGSNNWVVDSEKSASGKPILAYDPHVWLSLPSMWYEAHLVCPDRDVYGIALLASPYIIYGFNRHIAWGGTTLNVDVKDYYSEKIDSTNHQYLYKGKWHPIKSDTVIFKVRGSENTRKIFESTRHGPLQDRGDKSVALRWVGHEATTELVAFSRLNRAKNYGEFVEALRHYHVSGQNFAYADIYGNIAMWCTGRVPIRQNSDPKYLMDGSSGKNEWVGFVPFEQLPHSINPTQHYLFSANQIPVGPDYPYDLGSAWEPSCRARRIHQLLSSQEKISFEDMKKFHSDIIDVRAQRFLPAILEAGERLGEESPGVQELLSFLKSWDGRVDKDSQGPLIFRTFLHLYKIATWADDFEKTEKDPRMVSTAVLEQLTLEDPESHWFDDSRTEQIETRDEIIIKSLIEASRYLEKNMGKDTDLWKWGMFNMVDIRHPSQLKGLGYPPFPGNGNRYTVAQKKGNVAPNWRMVIEMAENGRRVGIYPGGQSGNPVSKNYDNGIQRWADHHYYQLSTPKTPEEIPEDQIGSVLILKPGR